ncbi:hepatoma-derived growth factor-related protein 2-like isoform X2 [Neoarius graeffei]|uniref:hepatoma-derived growth factor-related protein 2-like isoform X2 n=1 Tax=Neoarius graeffei TaxID=443677 RepID=UPI00298C6941|nr:hepatoma-derived growth factor-related protein 2-like isoform X2 [Neoarius graeffei]
MTGIQSRDESLGDSSDDEPLSKLVKPGKKCSEDTLSDIMEDASLKKTLKEPTSATDDCFGHNSDDEPLSKLIKSRGGKRSSKDQETGELLDSEDDQPLTMIIKKKKKKKQKADIEELEDAKKTRSPKKRKAVTKASKLRESSPSPSPSPVKVPQRRGRKGKDDSKKKASAHSPAVNMTPKRSGRAKKEGKALCSDSSDDELLRKKSELEMKQAVVLVERMSERDVLDAVARGRAHSQEQRSTARAESAAESSDEEPLSHKMKKLKEQSKAARGRRPAADASSDDEPLVRKVKTAKVKDKFRKRANGEEDTVKQDKELSEEDEHPH